MSDRLALSNSRIPKRPREKTPEARVRHLIGSLETGIPDLAENHRTYLIPGLPSGPTGRENRAQG